MGGNISQPELRDLEPVIGLVEKIYVHAQSFHDFAPRGFVEVVFFQVADIRKASFYVGTRLISPII